MRKKVVWTLASFAGIASAMVTLYAAASYPSAAKSFTTKLDGPGQTIFAAHINDLQDEVVAIENGLLSGFAHLLKPLSDATYDLGTSSLKWRDLYLSRNATVGGTLAVTGTTTLAGQIGGWTVVTTTATGAQNDFAPGLVGHTILRCNNATLLTISGFTGGASGQRLIVVSVGVAQVDLVPQATSAATNQLFNYVSSGNTSLAAGSGTAGSGTAEYVYDGTLARWRLVHHEQGPWITRTFSAGNFTASAGTWTVGAGDITTDAYILRGRTVTWMFDYELTTTSAGFGTDMRSAVIGGFTPAKQATVTTRITDNATLDVGKAIVPSAGTFMILRTRAETAWTSGVTDLDVAAGEIAFEVN